jgi:IS30 family transposase
MDLADYINEYNDDCPHKALGYKTPSKVFADFFTPAA